MVKLVTYVQDGFRGSPEWAAVETIAEKLLAELNTSDTLARIVAANRPRGASQTVQNAFGPAARALGFESERTGLFADTIAGLRPDYFLPLEGTGILLEVERGKTTTNNMDLLDFWKCHICGVAHYLFLLVPQELRHNDEMAPKREFDTVARRLKPFFEPDRYTNVRGLCLFGY
jgi:hypothetical protein